jgi:protein-tyrosine phosphatase
MTDYPALPNDERRPKAPDIPRMVVDFNRLREAGGKNFRDLGGHPAGDGRRVRRGKIYRSSHLARIPDEHPVRQMAVRTLVTLQSQVELRLLGAPHQDVLRHARWEHLPIGERWFRDGGAIELASQPGKEHLVMLTGFASDWRRFFAILAQRDAYPLVFHCSAGRDRTGVASAMLLELLGVGRDIIVEDFLKSNLVFPDSPLTAAQLTPVFETIDQAGGIRGFLREFMKVPDAEMEVIREELLE